MKKLVILCLLVVSSCGTIFGGKTQTIKVTTSTGDSVNAEIVSGDGVTSTQKLPTIVVVARSKAGVIVKVKESECYKESQSAFESKMNGFFFLNLLGSSSSSTSTTIDSVTGAIWSYDESVVVNLRKKPSCQK